MLQGNIKTGYQYIDDEMENIKNQLPLGEREKLEKLCGNIYSAAYDEGYYNSKIEQPYPYNEH